jgi:hypothetical protein
VIRSLTLRGSWSSKFAATISKSLYADDGWQVIERSSSRVQHQQQMSLGYQIAASINLNRPWQLAAAEGVTKRPPPPPLPPAEAETPPPPAEAETPPPSANTENPPPIENTTARIPKATVLSLSPFDRGGETWFVTYVIALLIAFIPYILTCNSLVREQDTATLERLLVVPGVSWNALMIGKALLPFMLGTADLFLLMLLSNLVFHTEQGPAGSATLAIQLLAILSSTFLGVTVATVVRSQLQAYLSSALYLVCLVLFTGFTFPVSQAPGSIKFASLLFPLTFSLEPLSAWMLLGTESIVFMPELGSVLVQCTAYAGLATFGALLYRARV